MALFIARVVFIDFYSLLLLPFMPFGHDQQIYTDIDTTQDQSALIKNANVQSSRLAQ